MVSSLTQIMNRYLMIVTLNQQPCPDVVNATPFRALSQWWRVFMRAIFLKRQANPNHNDFWSGTLSVGPNMVNDSPFRALSHWWRVDGSEIKRKYWQNLTLMTVNREPCQFVPVWLMTLSLDPCHTGSVCMVAQCFYKYRHHLTLMTLNLEPCQLVPMWLMPLWHCKDGYTKGPSP